MEKKQALLGTFLLGNLVLFSLFTGITQGSDGARLSGGGCGQLEAPPAEDDSDQDGVADLIDNCPASFNPHQNDDDGDGIGEVCEIVEAFDGQLECSFPSCNDVEDCFNFMEEACPADNIEFALADLSMSCCDQVCVFFARGEAEDMPACPAGSCMSPFPHCAGDEECQAAGFDLCFEGCCVGEEPVPCGPCECPPEDPECFCPPPCTECPNGEPGPQCFEGEGCPPEEICREDGCCVTDVPPPPPPPPPPPM
ncbi:MAG TPA: thrombospondin type 3 repeat-containing protein [bacterium]|nr:thrombospondin type 3 repeat-containing protein [bacterium]